MVKAPFSYFTPNPLKLRSAVDTTYDERTYQIYTNIFKTFLDIPSNAPYAPQSSIYICPPRA
jgi:hypothetical protein